MEKNMKINIEGMKVELLGYIKEKIKWLNRQMIRLEILSEEIEKQSELQNEYIEEFNLEVEELIRVAENIKINKE